jgi:D-alanyl-lipoteichoic acid acyltransferase DltB (MBOAT superfamily)
MLFNSWIFIAFFLVVLGFYYRLGLRGQNVMLLVASYVFYGWWDYRFTGLLVVSTLTDYVAGLLLAGTDDPRRRRILVAFSIGVNLGILGFFKYFDFFVNSTARVLEVMGFSVSLPALNIILPLGISFYTFQTMSYTIDVYKRRIEPTRDLVTFALYVAYFPQLVAGPILRAADLIPQLEKPRRTSRDQVIQGLWLCLWGYFKKMVVADNLAVYADEAFLLDPTTLSGVQCLLGTYAFAFQIYCDFSGYSDIARGTSKLMGVELMRNFHLPYAALNPSDFWRRWHISLSTWLRDYLYIPLGGNRVGSLATYRNLAIVMLLGGLWHGAAWHFVWWGAFHGLLLALHRLFLKARAGSEASTWWGRLACRAVMFHLACLGWMVFRADSMAHFMAILRNIGTNFTWDARAAGVFFGLLLYGGLLWGFELWLQNVDDPRTRPGWNKGAGALAIGVLGLLLLIFSAEAGHQFIYFQF